MVKKTRRPIENSGNHSNKTRIIAALLVFVLLGSGVALVFSNSDSKYKYDLEINALKSIKIVSKDSKGDPKIYQMNIKVEIKLIENYQNIKEINFEEYFNYNNNSNKFELKQYEKSIEDNLIEKNIENLTFYISSIK